jgi:hypothetical protein
MILRLNHQSFSNQNNKTKPEHQSLPVLLMKRICRRCLWMGHCETCELRRDGRVGGTSDAVQTPCGVSSE